MKDRPDPSETTWLAARLASTLDGEPLATVAARHGVSLTLLRGRLRRGMSTRQAATETPEQARRACRDRATLAVGRTMQRPASSRHVVATVDPDVIAPRERKIRVRTARTVTVGDTLVHEDRSTSTVTRVERVGSDVRLVYATGSLTIAARARVTVWA